MNEYMTGYTWYWNTDGDAAGEGTLPEVEAEAVKAWQAANGPIEVKSFRWVNAPSDIPAGFLSRLRIFLNEPYGAAMWGPLIRQPARVPGPGPRPIQTLSAALLEGALPSSAPAPALAYVWEWVGNDRRCERPYGNFSLAQIDANEDYAAAVGIGRPVWTVGNPEGFREETDVLYSMCTVSGETGWHVYRRAVITKPEKKLYPMPPALEHEVEVLLALLRGNADTEYHAEVRYKLSELLAKHAQIVHEVARADIAAVRDDDVIEDMENRLADAKQKADHLRRQMESTARVLSYLRTSLGLQQEQIGEHVKIIERALAIHKDSPGQRVL